MILQSAPAGCGAAAFANALRAVGGPVLPQEAAERLCRTNADGTTSENLVKAARATGFRAETFESRGDGALATVALHGFLVRGQPCILVVDHDSHWVTAVGTLGRRFLVADPADGRLVLAYSEDSLLRRWRGPRSRFFGITLRRAKD